MKGIHRKAPSPMKNVGADRRAVSEKGFVSYLRSVDCLSLDLGAYLWSELDSQRLEHHTCTLHCSKSSDRVEQYGKEGASTFPRAPIQRIPVGSRWYWEAEDTTIGADEVHAASEVGRLAFGRFRGRRRFDRRHSFVTYFVNPGRSPREPQWILYEKKRHDDSSQKRTY